MRRRTAYTIILPAILVAGAFVWGGWARLSAQAGSPAMTPEDQAQFETMLQELQQSGGMDVLLDEVERRLGTLERQRQVAEVAQETGAADAAVTAPVAGADDPVLMEGAMDAFGAEAEGMEEASFDATDHVFLELEDPFTSFDALSEPVPGNEDAAGPGAPEIWALPMGEDPGNAAPAMDAAPVLPASAESPITEESFLPPLLPVDEPSAADQEPPVVPEGDMRPAAADAPIEVQGLSAEDAPKPSGLLGEMGLFFRTLTDKIAGWFW